LQKWKKQVGIIISAERGVHSSAEIYMSAGENFIPSMIIFHRQIMTSELRGVAQTKTHFSCNQSGWMKLKFQEPG
jgi:hypothetical protein